MKRVISVAVLVTLAAAISAVLPAHAQDGDRLTVSFSDPSRPGLLRVNFVNGGVTVKTHAGREVIIEGKSVADRNRRQAPRTEGLRRIDNNVGGLQVEEENNVMAISAGGFGNGGNIEVQVPARTNLKLTTVNGGSIVVDGVEGEIEVNNTNGDVMLTNVAGSVVAHATNGKIVASLRELTPNKPMSFTTMNANVDVTLPANTKANLKMRTDNGEVYIAEFDNFQQRPSTPPVVTDNRRNGGRFRITTDRTINATINGGGPDFEVRTLNGNIYLRKK